jgi:hypothetical protein
MGLLNAMTVLAEEWDDVQSKLDADQASRLRDLVAQFVAEGDPEASSNIAEDMMDLLTGGLPITHAVLRALASSEDRSRGLADPAADRAWFQLAAPLRARLASGPPGTSFGDDGDDGGS